MSYILIAVPFEAGAGTVSGEPIILASRATTDPRQGRGAFSVSASGLVAYRAGSMMSSATELVWIDRNGNAMSTLPAQGFTDLTTDGQRIAVVQRTPSRSNTDIWLIETARGVPRQFTFDPAFDVRRRNRAPS